MFMLFAGLIAASGSILLSDICVNGVDNKIELIIDNTKLNVCSKDLLKQYISCDGRNMSCSPIKKTIVDVKSAIKELNETEDKTENINKTIQSLVNMENSLITLSNCNQSKSFYRTSTVTLCGEMNSSILRASTTMVLITYLSFVFFIVFYFNWNRFKEGPPEGYSRVRKGSYGDQRLGSISKSSQRRNSSRQLEDFGGPDQTSTSPQDWSIGCIFYTIIIIAIWGLLTFGCVVVVSIGSQKVPIYRSQ